MKEKVDFVLNPSDMKHVYNDHFGGNEKDKGNNVPLKREDVRHLYDVLSHPDGVLYGIDRQDGRKLFFFLKQKHNRLYNLAEVCSTKKGNLTAKSYYITKKGIDQRVMEIKNSLLPTSVTYFGESLSDAKIPQLFEDNNNYGGNHSGGERKTPMGVHNITAEKQARNSQSELEEYVREELGEGYSVESTGKVIPEMKGLRAVVVTKEYTRGHMAGGGER